MQDHYSVWCNSIYGKEFYKTEIQTLENNLNNVFGFHVLQIGAEELDYLQDLEHKLKINHKIILSTQFSERTELKNNKYKNILYAKDSVIPLASQSIDAVLLSHAFEFTPDPHGLLREVDRILLPEGRLIILCFNPWSLWGLRKSFTFKKPPSMNAEKIFPWDDGHKWLSSHRVLDWLSLLNYKILYKKHYFFRPCVNNEKIFKYTKIFDQIGKLIPLGAAGFCIIAVKKQLGFELIKPTWQSDINFKPINPINPIKPIEPSIRIDINK